MRVKLLLAPDFRPRTEYNYPPLGLALIASSLRQGGHFVDQDDLDVKCRHHNIDLSSFSSIESIEPHELNTIELRYKSELNTLVSLSDFSNFDVMGISIFEPSNLLLALLLAKHIRAKYGTKIILGGRIGIDHKLLKYDFVDFILSGPGEKSFLSLVDSLEKKDSLDNVPGLLRRSSSYSLDKSCLTNQSSIVHIDEIPIPDFDGLPLEYYKIDVSNTTDKYYDSYSDKLPVKLNKKILILPYFLNIGCPFNCSFCSESGNDQKNLQFRKPETIRKELEIMMKKYDTKYFFFLDSTLNANNKWLDEVCDQLKDLDILWCDSGKPSDLSQERFHKLREAGCIRLVWGVESLNEPTLKVMNKCFNVKDGKSTLERSHNAGIWNYTNWIVGFPHETDNNFNETLKNIDSVKQYIDDFTVTGFILQFSDMFLHPNKYGIEFISTNSYGKAAKDRMNTSSFNELNGLPWTKKSKQIENHKRQLDLFLEKRKNVPLRVPIHTLFYLYDKFENKDLVRKWLNSLY